MNSMEENIKKFINNAAKEFEKIKGKVTEGINSFVNNLNNFFDEAFKK